jgi:gliding motility-associated-like protein
MKKILVIFVLLFFFKAANGQNTFVKSIAGLNFGQNVRVFQTADQGIAVFSLDSLMLYKFNSCGEPEWAKQYKIPKLKFYPGDINQTRNGGFILLNRIPNGANYSTSITLLSAAGNIVWDKEYKDPDYTHFPYTISEDANGDFIMVANVNQNSPNVNYNAITKLDANGNLRWTRFYNIGPIWGGAIPTSDAGILARFGNSFLKTDNTGNVQWAANIGTSDYYFPPVEVSDGYIFTGTSMPGNKISFHKVDKQGNLLWGGRKVLDYSGLSSLLYRKSNGNFAGVFTKNGFANIIEFDKELNIIKQSALNFKPNEAFFNGKHVGFSNENTTLIAGICQINLPNNSRLFFARTDNQFKTGCDTTLTTTITTEPVAINTITTSTASHTFTVVNKTHSFVSIPITVTSHCNSIIPANIRSDSLLCTGSALILKDNSGAAWHTYRWSTGETTPTITVNKPGKYWLHATNNCGSLSASDTVFVTEVPFPKPALTADTAICQDKPVLINAEIPGATYRWQNGSTNAVYHATKPGRYEVEITRGNCTKKFSVQIGDFEKLLMPNVFTPNGDDLNDNFAPMEMCGLASGTLKIFNRWGQLIYTTSEISKGWNGMVNSNKVAAGVYFYMVEYIDFSGQQKMKKGWVDLVGN